jgi:hypothetical protein
MAAINNIVTVDGRTRKRCGHCKVIKSTDCFNSCKYSATGYRSQCKDCMKQQRKSLGGYYAEWREKDSTKEFYRGYARRASKAAPIRIWARNKARALERMPCEVCGTEKAEAHHTDYLKPTDVMWLCRAHHINWHAENGPGKNHCAAIPAENNGEAKSGLSAAWPTSSASTAGPKASGDKTSPTQTGVQR